MDSVVDTAGVLLVDDDGKRIGYTNENTPNNWGRWGHEDERGTTNFITPDLVKEAAVDSSPAGRR